MNNFLSTSLFGCVFVILLVDSRSAALYTKPENDLFIMNCDIDGMCTLYWHSIQEQQICSGEVMLLDCLSGDMENQVEMEEKTRLINQVLELQHTLEGDITIIFFHVILKLL